MFKPIFLALVLLLALTSPARAYTYEAFPSLPVATVKKSDFVQKLRDVCKAQIDITPPPPGFLGQLQPVCKKLYRRDTSALDEKDIKVLKEAAADPNRLNAVGQGSAASDATVSGLPTLGGLSDQLIRGMAEFLQKRAQQEALRYLRLKLKKDLCEGTDEAGQVRKAAFSNVCAAIESLADNVSLEAMGSYIRAAAERDLKKLPDLLLDYVEQKPKYAEPAFAARVGLATFEAARGGRPVFEILYSFGELERQSCETATAKESSCLNVGNALRLASALTYAFQQGGDDNTAFYKNLKLEDARIAAVGLLLLVDSRLKELAGGKEPTDLTNRGAVGVTIDEKLINFVILNPLAVVNDVIALRKVWTNLEEALKKVTSAEGREDALATAVIDSSTVVVRVAEYANTLQNGGGAPLSRLLAKLNDFVRIADLLRRRDYGGAIVASLEQLKAVAPDEPGVNQLASHIGFIVELASAQSSNDVAATFDAYAAPLGTYELKYKKPMIALNGFLGAQAGWERMGSDGLSGRSSAYGGFAPIGIHASYPLIKEWLHTGVLLSVLDLGAVTSIRHDDTAEGSLPNADMDSTPKTKNTAQIGFGQVFSPGAYLVLGILGSPLVTGFGVSLSPELREVQQSGALTTDVSVVRYCFFAAVDIPILPFSN